MLFLMLVFAALITFAAGTLSILLRKPMHRPALDAPLYETGEFIQQSFMSGLILCAMALGASISALITGADGGWQLFAAIGVGCLVGSLVSSRLFASPDQVER